jgi:hypothetical protein
VDYPIYGVLLITKLSGGFKQKGATSPSSYSFLKHLANLIEPFYKNDLGGKETRAEERWSSFASLRIYFLISLHSNFSY